MEKGRIDFDDPTFRERKKVMLLEAEAFVAYPNSTIAPEQKPMVEIVANFALNILEPQNVNSIDMIHLLDDVGTRAAEFAVKCGYKKLVGDMTADHQTRTAAAMLVAFAIAETALLRAKLTLVTAKLDLAMSCVEHCQARGVGYVGCKIKEEIEEMK